MTSRLVSISLIWSLKQLKTINQLLISFINLTRIYYGELPYHYYLIRDFGMVNKIFYGWFDQRSRTGLRTDKKMYLPSMHDIFW
ncbi:MAG: hypothetical protein IIB73_08245 [Proteobacteria bacterium]|nr:hypothetical protein [Pseudomonadota bacterium]